MSTYPPKIDALFRHAKHVGAVDDANGRGRSAAFECGCAVGVSLNVDPGEKVVKNAGFGSNGCGYMIAAAELAVSAMIGQKVQDLGILRDDNAQDKIFSEIICEVPAERRHCLEAPLAAAISALEDHRQAVINEFKGETALICTCFGVSEERIMEFAASGSNVTVDDVAENLKAGSGCGSCRMLIQEILDANI